MNVLNWCLMEACTVQYTSIPLCFILRTYLYLIRLLSWFVHDSHKQEMIRFHQDLLFALLSATSTCCWFTLYSLIEISKSEPELCI